MRLSNKKRKQVRRLARSRPSAEVARELGIPLTDVERVLEKRASKVARTLAPAKPDLPTSFLPWLFILVIAWAPLAPALAREPGIDHGNLNQTLFLLVGSWLVLSLWCLRGALSRPWHIRYSTFELPLGMALTWSALSLVWALNRYEGILVLAQWVPAVLCHSLALQLLDSERRIRNLLTGLFLAGIAVACIGLSQHYFNFTGVPQASSPSATFVNRNMAAHFMVLTLPLGVLSVCTWRGRAGRSAATVGALLLALYLYHTGARGAWFGAAAGLAVMAGILLRRYLHTHSGDGRKRAHLIAVAAGTALLFLAATAVFLVAAALQETPAARAARTRQTATVQTPQTPETGGSAAAVAARPAPARENRLIAAVSAAPLSRSAGTRIGMWLDTLVMLREKPWHGWGVGNMRLYYPARCKYYTRLGRAQRYRYPENTHNDYLQTLAELGIVGFLLWACVALLVARSLWRCLRRDLPPEQRLVVAAVAGALVGIALNASFSFPLYRAIPPVLVLVYHAVLLQLLHQYQTAAGGMPVVRTAAAPRKLAVALSPVCIGLCVLVSVTAYRWRQADVCYYRMAALSLQRQREATLAEVDRLLAHNRLRKHALYYRGVSHMALGDYPEAIRAFNEFLHYYPYDRRCWFNLGNVLFLNGDDDQALARARGLVDTFPNKREKGNPYVLMAKIYRKKGQAEQAYEVCREGIAAGQGGLEMDAMLGPVALALKHDDVARKAFANVQRRRPRWWIGNWGLGVTLIQDPATKHLGLEYLQKALGTRIPPKYAKQVRQILRANSSAAAAARQPGETD